MRGVRRQAGARRPRGDGARAGWEAARSRRRSRPAADPKTSPKTPRQSSRDSSRRSRRRDETRSSGDPSRDLSRDPGPDRPERLLSKTSRKITRDSRPRGRNPRAGRVARGRGTRPPPMGARKRARGAQRRATRRRGGCLLARGMYALTRAVLEPRMKTFLSRRMKTVRSLLSPHPETTVVVTPPPRRAWRGGP